jgi:hypothetical protein
MDLIEIEDAREAGPLQNEIPLEDLIRQHRIRYDVATSKGNVRLRFIGALKRRTIELDTAAADPEIAGRRDDLKTVTAMLKDRPDDKDLKAQQLQLASSLEASFFDLFAGCFDRPRMRRGTEVMAFADALKPEEWRMVRVLLIQLIAARPSGDVATVMIDLCTKYGVRISEDLSLENMTAQQMWVLDQAATAEFDAIVKQVNR